MKWDLTINSNTMNNFYLKNNGIPHISSTDRSSPFISVLHSDMEDAHAWIELEKKKKGPQFYNLNMAKIK